MPPRTPSQHVTKATIIDTVQNQILYLNALDDWLETLQTLLPLERFLRHLMHVAQNEHLSEFEIPLRPQI